jgi:acetyl esterase/lipase
MLHSKFYSLLTLLVSFLVVLLSSFTISNNTQQTSLTTFRDVEYTNVDGISLKLDLYVPNHEGPFPVVVWIHGGAWSSGDKSNPPALREVSRGYAVVSINYRLSSQAIFPAQINDCKAAIRWLRAHAAQYNLNPNRIAAWGRSAGGHLAALLGTSGDVSDLEDFSQGNASVSSQIQAVIDWFGPTDVLQMDAQALPCSSICHDCPNSPESRLVGCPIQTCPDRAARANPIRYITADAPPFLIHHGTEDCAVPPMQSQILYDALQLMGVDATLLYLEGAGHGGPEFRDPAILAEVDAFLDQKLGVRNQESGVRSQKVF